MRRPLHVHPQVGPDVPPGFMPDLWGFGASEEQRRRLRGRRRGAPCRPEPAGPADRLAELIERIGKLFA